MAVELDCREAHAVFEQEVEGVLVDQSLRLAAYQHIWQCPRDRRSPCPARALVERVWGNQGRQMNCEVAQKIILSKDWSKIGTAAQEQRRWQAFYHVCACGEAGCRQVQCELLTAIATKRGG